jgi:hypothetical protein
VYGVSDVGEKRGLVAGPIWASLGHDARSNVVSWAILPFSPLFFFFSVYSNALVGSKPEARQHRFFSIDWEHRCPRMTDTVRLNRH